MRFFTILTATLATAISAVSASTAASDATLSTALSGELSLSNHYGAPIPPWQKGCKPGWYYGDHPETLEGILRWLKDSLICKLLDLLPLCLHCPKPFLPHHPGGGSPVWTPVFTGGTCAVQADDYLTYGLVDTVDDCRTMCASVNGCTFFNTYHDNNAKDGSTKLTCALFSKCHDKGDADNCGRQTQPNGSVNFITESAGYCKK